MNSPTPSAPPRHQGGQIPPCPAPRPARWALAKLDPVGEAALRRSQPTTPPSGLLRPPMQSVIVWRADTPRLPPAFSPLQLDVEETEVEIREPWVEQMRQTSSVRSHFPAPRPTCSLGSNSRKAGSRVIEITSRALHD
jgi:hypothetical protein